ncbi:MAG: hypothetical protein WBO46_12595 [Caldilineaceae bacterium]
MCPLWVWAATGSTAALTEAMPDWREDDRVVHLRGLDVPRRTLR